MRNLKSNKFGSKLFKFLFSVMIWILLSFTLVPFFLLLFTIRLIVSKLVPLIFSEVVNILPAPNSLLAVELHENRAHVVFCFELEGKVELEDVRSTFESRVIQKKNLNGKLQWPELQQFIVHKFGYPFWQWEKSFNVQNHIRTLHIGSKFNEERGLSSQEILDAIEERLIHKPFATEQSPWELLLVPNFRDTVKDESAISKDSLGTLLLFKFDHALGDGTSVGGVFEEFFDGGDNSLNSKSSISCSSGWNKLTTFFFGPYDLIRHGYGIGKFNWRVNNKIKTYNAAVSPPIPVDRIQNIRNSNNASFTAVTLALIGNALYKFMREGGYEVPATVSCSLVRLVDSHPRSKLTNHFAMIQSKLPMERHPGHISTIQSSINACLGSAVPEMSFYFFQLLGVISTKWNQKVVTLIAGDGDLALSNLQLYEHEKRFKDKHRLRSIFYRVTVPSGTNGIVFTSVGCKEGLRLLFQIDEGIVPRTQLHAEVFIKYFLEELELMTQSIS